MGGAWEEADGRTRVKRMHLRGGGQWQLGVGMLLLGGVSTGRPGRLQGKTTSQTLLLPRIMTLHLLVDVQQWIKLQTSKFQTNTH